MPAEFQNSALTALYNGSGNATLTAALERFRTGKDIGSIPDLDTDIDSLDKRIAMFESVLFSAAPNNGGNAGNEYPYDKEGMKREFLDEVLALLLRRSVQSNGLDFAPNEFVALNILAKASAEYPGGEILNWRQGSDQRVIAAHTGASNFGDLVSTSSDTRRNLLNDAGKLVYDRYALLIDEVFKEGEKLALNPAGNVQVSAAIPALEIEGNTYERVASESDITVNPPVMRTYLIEAGAKNSSVIKDGSGNVQLTDPGSVTANRLLLEPRKAAGTAPNFVVAVDATTVEVSLSGQTILVDVRPVSTPVAATVIPPFRIPVPGKEDAFPNTFLQITHRAEPSNGVPYLVGTSSDGGVYVISVAGPKRTSIGATRTLSSVEYLYFFNEARIKILRAKLAYNEAVVREIQDDLKRANEVLADLEARSGLVRATDSDNNPTNQYSAETLKMNLFNATNSPAGQSIFSEAGGNSLHTATDWQENRTNLKNYIDRRSAEAQQATLDYQNILNRFNNAFEVMGKLQEKLDTLLKAQLRNMG